MIIAQERQAKIFISVLTLLTFHTSNKGPALPNEEAGIEVVNLSVGSQ